MNQAKPGAYESAYQKAGLEIRVSDLEELCERSGAVLNGRTIRVSFFGSRVEILIPENGSVEFQPSEVPLPERILILHYLLGRESRPFYDQTYQKRGPQRIARRFGQNVAEFRKACRSLNWQEAELGDASFQFDILPKIRGLLVLHAGDEEFPPEVNILFNDEIGNFLPLEDVAVLAGLIATRLSKSINIQEARGA
jgi:hypothetical protein